MLKKIYAFIEGVFPLAVVVGVFWAISAWSDSNSKKDEAILDKKIEAMCSNIKQQQPNNVSLYDECMNSGYEQFGSE